MVLILLTWSRRAALLWRQRSTCSNLWSRRRPGKLETWWLVIIIICIFIMLWRILLPKKQKHNYDIFFSSTGFIRLEWILLHVCIFYKPCFWGPTQCRWRRSYFSPALVICVLNVFIYGGFLCFFFFIWMRPCWQQEAPCIPGSQPQPEPNWCKSQPPSWK